ncbi:uncharacterized protein LOC101772938 [Setaria italica]|uniref:uncharacterized protein LOC101772938 n=1 Tax=Setaria italica TaxID=4555 RepID=UPI0003512D22|nr:uncharacterized protein LOC101772938 [Setaria italica]
MELRSGRRLVPPQRGGVRRGGRAPRHTGLGGGGDDRLSAIPDGELSSRAMELRSGRRLVPPQGGVVRRGGRARRHRADRLSALPDEILLQVLAALGSTAAAARTTVLGRRWAGLWPELHVLAQAFRGVEPACTFRDVLAGGRRRPDTRHLVLHVSRRDDGVVTAAEVTSLLRAAEKHRPPELTLIVGGASEEDRRLPFELPCFATATYMELQIWRRSFTLPPAGEFTRLERLSISLCVVDPSVFLDRCPCLRKLVMDGYWEQDAVAVRSESLEEVVIKDLPLAGGGGGASRRVDVVAPLLKKVTLFSCGKRGLVMKFSDSSNNVENLSYKYYSMSSCSVGSGCWRLKGLDMAMAVESSSSGYGPANLVRVLSLEIIALNEPYHARVNRIFAEEIACLPAKNFSVLKLELPLLDGFVVGPLVFHLLSTVSVIQKLQMVLSPIATSYARRGSRIRVDQDTSFTELEEVDIHGFDCFLNGILEECEDNLPQGPSHVGGMIGC